MSDANAFEQVSVEDDKGRILSGVGVTPESLQATIDARVKPDGTEAATNDKASGTPSVDGGNGPTTEAAGATTASADAAVKPELERNDDGTFKKARGQKRFDQLTKEREDARREAEELRKQLDALKTQTPTTPAAQPIAPTQTWTPPVAATPQTSTFQPRAVQYPDALKDYDSYLKLQGNASYDDYLDARADFRSQQTAPNLDAQIRQAIEADRASRALAERVNESVDRGRKAYADFDAVIAGCTVDFPWPVLFAIAEMPNTEHVQYQLAKNPPFAQQIAQLARMNPFQVGIELAKLGPSPSVASPASTGRSGVTTSAPPPMQPVGAGTKTTVPPLAELADKGGDDYDSSGYRERRRAELRAGARR